MLSLNLPGLLLGTFSVSQTLALPYQPGNEYAVPPQIIPRSSSYKYPISQHIIPLNPPEKVYIDNFSASIKIGNQTLLAVMDTGSSNIWFMTPFTQCVNPQTFAPIECGYKGPKYTPDASFSAFPDQHANISYVIGDVLSGAHGIGNVTFGDIEIDTQQLSLVSHAKTAYTGPYSGLVGLAYQSITSIYPGLVPANDVACGDSPNPTVKNCNQAYYRPLLSTLFQRNLTKPIFAFALSRSTQTGGVMTLGGIPDLKDAKVNATSGREATVPIEKLKGANQYSHYVITVDSLQYPGAAAGAGQGQYIVDTGTVNNIFPQEQAEAINALFDPPGVYTAAVGAWVVRCNATAPEFSVGIGGQSFGMNAKELIVPVNLNGIGCVSAITNGTATGGSINLLGSLFLRNVLAVFDVGKTQMTFSSRMYYEE